MRKQGQGSELKGRRYHQLWDRYHILYAVQLHQPVAQSCPKRIIGIQSGRHTQQTQFKRQSYKTTGFCKNKFKVMKDKESLRNVPGERETEET